MANKHRLAVLMMSCAFSIFLGLVIGELLLYFVYPQKYMYPRWEFSTKYGNELYANTVMIQACPRKWRFVYTINEARYRGKFIPISETYVKKNIVFLGDSNTFGHGVNDGEEYPAVIGDLLHDQCDVINLAAGGWGLTQQIRKYYELGSLYKPTVVVLQFSGNDPKDNFVNRVTDIENGKFVFLETNNAMNQNIAFLSRSIVQRSQIYNLFKNTFFSIFRQQMINKGAADYHKETAAVKDKDMEPIGKVPITQNTVGKAEWFYVKLLELFAHELKQDNITLIFISAGEGLEDYRYIKSKVLELDKRKELVYCDISPWFYGEEDYGSKEGHIWGVKGHHIIGENLTKIMKENYL